MTTPSNISARMSQPWFMQGREYRRDGVPTYIVDGDAWPPKPVDGDDAWALFCASADGDLDKAQRLIDGEPNLVHAQIWYAKPIDVAMREGHLEIMKAMLDADEQRWLFDHTWDWCYRTTENEMRRRGFDELVEYRKSWKTSLASNFRPEIDGTQPKADAPDINKLDGHNKTSLTRTRANELLVEYGAVDPDENDFAKVPQEVVELVYPVHWMESVEAIESWAKHYGPDRLKDLWWGLGPHSRPGREAMEALVRHGHDVNHPDWWGRTLLQAEAAEGNLDRAKMLLELGADLHLIDVQSHTNALGYAARQGRVEMVKFFLEQGADKNPNVPTWAKPLQYAIDYLEDHTTRYSETEHGQSRLNGHRTNQPASAYEEIIQLLS